MNRSLQSILLVAITATLSFTAEAQQQRQVVQYDVFYPEGSDLLGPLSGVEATVPKGWKGIVPRGSELFALLPQDGSDGEIFVRANQGTLDEVPARWNKGLDMGSGILTKLDGEIIERGNTLTAEYFFAGGSGQYRGYIETKCGDHGWCVSISSITTSMHFEDYKKVVQNMMDDTELVEPQPEIDVYEKFDWSKFLRGKYLVYYEFRPKYEKINNVWLCKDGTFMSDLVRKKTAKAEKNQYTGRKKGTWEAKGIGATGELILNFEKKPPVNISMLIDDDKVYAQGQRYFVMVDDKCAR